MGALVCPGLSFRDSGWLLGAQRGVLGYPFGFKNNLIVMALPQVTSNYALTEYALDSAVTELATMRYDVRLVTGLNNSYMVFCFNHLFCVDSLSILLKERLSHVHGNCMLTVAIV